MSRLSLARRTQITGALDEGNSIRSTERMTDMHRDTLMRLMVEAGTGCAKLQSGIMRGFPRIFRDTCVDFHFQSSDRRPPRKKLAYPDLKRAVIDCDRASPPSCSRSRIELGNFGRPGPIAACRLRATHVSPQGFLE